MTGTCARAAKVLGGIILALVIGAALASPAAAATAAGETWRPDEVASDGKPVAWACGTQFVYLYNAPTPAHRRVVLDALTKLNASTSTKFVLAGSTKKSPRATGGSDKAIVVGYDTFDAKYAGWASNSRVGDRYVKGYSLMNLAVPYIAKPSTSSQWSLLTNTVLHELGHLVGLDHVEVDSQVMFDGWNVGRKDYNRGDRSGLARLGCRAGGTATGAAVTSGSGLPAATGPVSSPAVARV